MKKQLSMVAVCLMGMILHGAEPVYEWDFERWENGRTPSAKGDVLMWGQAAPEAGYQGTVGAVCHGQVRTQTINLPLHWKAFSCEMKFKLDKPLDGKRWRTLLCYETFSWNRRRLLLTLDRQGCLRADFRVLDEEKKQDNRFTVKSTPLNLPTGRYQTVRLATQSGGELKLWLNGRLIAGKNNAWSLCDLKMTRRIPEYPILAFGFDRDDPRKISSPLNGTIDEVKLWNSYQEPNPETAMTADVSPHLVLNGEWTRPFTVLDHEQGPAGNFVMADDVFVKNAGTASALFADNELVVRFRSPVPAGMKAHGGKNVWRGNVNEFFFRPNPKKPVYFQYAVNDSGKSYAQKYLAPGSEASDWQSKAVFAAKNSGNLVETEIRIPLTELDIKTRKPGTLFTGNFTRSGQTAGGLSTWAPVGHNFHNLESFAPLLLGSRQDYFRNRLHDWTELAQKYGLSTAELSQLINQKADDPAQFDRICQAFDALKLAVLQKKRAGMRQFIFRPDVWSNDPEADLVTRPLERIHLVMARNSRHYTGFAIANLTDRPFVGQVKCFPKKPFQSAGTKFNSEPFDAFCQQIRFAEGVETWNASGSPLYDCVSPLPLNTLIRIPPKKTLPIWMEIGTQGLPAGTHRGILALKDATGHPGMTFVNLEVEVRDVDLSSVHIDTFHYNYLQQSRAFTKRNIHEFLGRHEANYLYCTPGQMDLYPDQNPDGSLEPFDFHELDDMIRCATAGGIPQNQVKLHLYLAFNMDLGMRRPAPNGHPPRFDTLTPQWRFGVTETLKALGRHVREKYGMTPDRIVLCPIDEPNGDIDNPKSTLFLALQYCKFLKEAVPEMKVMVNPHPAELTDIRIKAYERLKPYVDIFEFYRPNVNDNPQMIALAHTLKKEIWTYSIASNATFPGIYRRDYWQNMRDGFSSVATYWNLDASGGGDAFDPTDTCWGSQNRVDEATVFADFNYGTILPSRRFLAGRMGQEDRKLFNFCQQRLLGKTKAAAELRKRLNAIVAQGAQGSMENMEKARQDLLELAVQCNRIAQ